MTGMYLEHYGVLGMKWGIRKKNPNKIYETANKYAWKSEKIA